MREKIVRLPRVLAWMCVAALCLCSPSCARPETPAHQDQNNHGGAGESNQGFDELEAAILADGSGGLHIILDAIRRYADGEEAELLRRASKNEKVWDNPDLVRKVCRQPAYWWLVHREANACPNRAEAVALIRERLERGSNAERLILLVCMQRVHHVDAVTVVAECANSASVVVSQCASDSLEMMLDKDVSREITAGIVQSLPSASIRKLSELWSLGTENRKKAVGLVMQWLDRNRGYVYYDANFGWHGWEGFCLSQDAREIGCPVDPESGECLDPVTRQPLCRHDIEERKRKQLKPDGGDEGPNKDDRK